ncbi:MAG: hypothetical protein OXT03_01130 [Alphaproteobacteria bacterium]|nr:hypothetical protein [Alphaproteobacteria bacterium]
MTCPYGAQDELSVRGLGIMAVGDSFYLSFARSTYAPALTRYGRWR